MPATQVTGRNPLFVGSINPEDQSVPQSKTVDLIDGSQNLSKSSD
jgi:hypothetical protein